MIINIRDNGAVGDGVNDDTNAIQSAINKIGKDGGVVLFPKGEYKVTNEILINNSNIILRGELGNLVKYYGKGVGINLINLQGTFKEPIHDIVIDGLNLDGTNQEYKGGASEENLSLTAPNPKYTGITAIYCIYGYRVRIINNKLNDFYGNGIRLKRCSFSTVQDNFLNDCSASGMASINTDYQGDGIAAFMSFSILVCNNTIINKRKFKVHYNLAKDVYDLQCGRSGLEFEYSLDKDVETNRDAWCPLSTELISNTTSGYNLIFENNYVYGYNKGCHLEYNVNARVEGNAFMHCNIGVLDATGGNTQIINNEFNSDNVGASPQGGYHLYYAGVAITHFLGTEYDTNPIIRGNIFYGDSRGVIIGRSKVDIRNNIFRVTSTGIYTVANWYHNLMIDGNEFVLMSNLEEDKLPYFLDVAGENNSFINNSFIARDGNIVNNILGGKNYIIVNNNCLNTILTSNNAIITNNNFSFIYKKNDDGSKSNKLVSMEAGYEFSSNIIKCRYCYTRLTCNNSIVKDNRFNFEEVKISSNILGASAKFIVCNNYINYDDTVEFGIENSAFWTDNRVEKNKYLKSIFKDNYINNYPVGHKIFFNYYGTILEELEFKNNTPNTYKGINNGTINPVNGKLYLTNEVIDKIYKGYYLKCVKEGYFSDILWKSNTVYTRNIFIINSENNVYRCKSEVNSTIEPKLKKDSFTTKDGVTWEYFGSVAKFEEYDSNNKLISN